MKHSCVRVVCNRVSRPPSRPQSASRERERRLLSGGGGSGRFDPTAYVKEKAERMHERQSMLPGPPALALPPMATNSYGQNGSV